MGCDEEDEELISSIKLPLLTILNSPQIMNSPERSGMLTPPLHASAAVPFRWEDEPGKPKPCTDLIPLTDLKNGGDYAPKTLELPPRLLIEANFGKNLSPTTVLEGPYLGKSSRFQSLSFRMVGGECYGSFRAPISPEIERGRLGAMVLGSNNNNKGHKLKDRRFLGSWKRKSPLMGNKGEILGGISYVFPSSSADNRENDDDDDYVSEVYVKKNNTRIKRVGSFSLLLSDPKSHFWGNIYQGLKQVIVPWRGRKQKKDGFILN